MPGGQASRSRATGRRDRLIALSTLLIVAALAWAWLWLEAGRMDAIPAMPGMSMAPGTMEMAAAGPWDAGVLLLTFVMWAVMMVGMMLPSAAPAITLYGGLARKHEAAGSALPATWIFAAGYLAVWAGFSVAAAVLQTWLAELRLITPMLASASVGLTAGLLIVAGVYQWLPFKDACLQKCRAPLQFFMFHWRPGPVGALRMGATHGAFCVGCCWALMLLLFAAGVMNLLWVAVIAGYVLVEKLLPGGRLIGRLAGVALVAAGVGMVLVQAA